MIDDYKSKKYSNPWKDSIDEMVINLVSRGIIDKIKDEIKSEIKKELEAEKKAIDHKEGFGTGYYWVVVDNGADAFIAWWSLKSKKWYYSGPGCEEDLIELDLKVTTVGAKIKS